MNFFGLLWAVSALSSFLFPQTTPRLLEDFSKATSGRTVSLVKPVNVAVTHDRSRSSLHAGSVRQFSSSQTFSQSSAQSRAFSSFASSSFASTLRGVKSSAFLAVLRSNSVASMREASLIHSDLMQQFISGLLRRSNTIRDLIGQITPTVTITIADNPCAATQRSQRPGWRLWPLGNNLHQSQLETDNFAHCTGLWQTDWSQPEPIQQVFQVRLRGHVIAEAPTYVEAEAIARQLYQVLRQPSFTPYHLVPAIVNGLPTGKAGDALVFSIQRDWATLLDRNPELLAIQWTNNLRTALNVPPLSLVDAQSQMYGLVPTDRQLIGVASWYGPYFHGQLTATGEVFHQHELTAAHPSLPFNTYLKVINQLTGKTVIVRVNDRGPYFEDRSLDLSLEAARCLGSEVKGIVPYEAVIMEKADLAQWHQSNQMTASSVTEPQSTQSTWLQGLLARQSDSTQPY